jgi:hypothetical protein
VIAKVNHPTKLFCPACGTLMFEDTGYLDGYCNHVVLIYRRSRFLVDGDWVTRVTPDFANRYVNTLKCSEKHKQRLREQLKVHQIQRIIVVRYLP